MQSATLRGRRGIVYRRALPGRAPGWRVVFDKPPLVSVGESFANIVPDANAAALGVLFEIDDADLAHIDLTEGMLIGNYHRIETAVEVLAPVPDPPVAAFTLTSDKRDASLQPSTRYMSLLIAGALEHGLPAEHVEFLRAVPARPESPEAEQFRPLIDQLMRRS